MISIIEFAKRGLVFVPTHDKAIIGVEIVFRTSFVINTTLDVGVRALQLTKLHEDFGHIEVRLFACVKTTHGIARIQESEGSGRKPVFDEIILNEKNNAYVVPKAFQLSIEPGGSMFDDIVAEPKFCVELDTGNWELEPEDAFLDSREKLERLNGRDLPKRFMSACFDLIERPA